MNDGEGELRDYQVNDPTRPNDSPVFNTVEAKMVRTRRRKVEQITCDGVVYFVHPAVTLFPLRGDVDFEALLDDVRANGIRKPIWLWRDPQGGRGYLLDGRSRTRACIIAKVPLTVRWYEGDDPVGFIVEINAHRRLTPNPDRIAWLRANWRSLLRSAPRRHVAPQAPPNRVPSGEGGTYQRNSHPVSHKRAVLQQEIANLEGLLEHVVRGTADILQADSTALDRDGDVDRVVKLCEQTARTVRELRHRAVLRRAA